MELIKILFLLLVLSTVSCRTNKKAIFREIITTVDNEYERENSNNNSNRLFIFLENKVLPINTTTFHKLIDSLKLIPMKGINDSFTVANLFDFNNYKPTYINNDLLTYNNSSEQLFGIKLNDNLQNRKSLFCSDIIENLITCEYSETDKLDKSNNMIFGNSTVYLFHIKNSKEVEYLGKRILQNN